MDYDLALVIGLTVGIFSIPAVVSSITEHRPPRVAAIALMIAGGLVAWATMKRPGGYELAEIPQVVVQVIGRLVN